MTRRERIERMFEITHSDLDKIMDSFHIKYAGVETLRNRTNVLRVIMNDPPNSPIFDATLTVEKLRSMQTHMEKELNRAFLNDLYAHASRMCFFIRKRLDSPQPDSDIKPDYSKEDKNVWLYLLAPFISKENKIFLEFFRKTRNSVVHYDGRHNVSNYLDYHFEGVHFLSKDKIGTPIEIQPRVLVGFYKRLKQIFDFSQFCQNPEFMKRLSVP